METLDVDNFPVGLLPDGIRKCAKRHIVIRDNRKEWLIKWENYQKAVIDKMNCGEDFDH